MSFLESLPNNWIYILVVGISTTLAASTYYFNSGGAINKTKNTHMDTLNEATKQIKEVGKTIKTFDTVKSDSITNFESRLERADQRQTFLEFKLDLQCEALKPNQIEIDKIKEELRLVKNIIPTLKEEKTFFIQTRFDLKVKEMWKCIDASSAIVENYDLASNFHEIASLPTPHTISLATLTATLFFTMCWLREPAYIIPWSMSAWSAYQVSFWCNTTAWLDNKLKCINDYLSDVGKIKESTVWRFKKMKVVNDRIKNVSIYPISEVSSRFEVSSRSELTSLISPENLTNTLNQRDKPNLIKQVPVDVPDLKK